ncbi:MAG: Ger(x)C family spore germination protein [Tissierella sp.]|nr:Ger(x)C family spore germination protein [Tissierella sp.]
MSRNNLLLGLIILTVFLSGCWDYREIEDVFLVSTIALDKDKNTKEYILNVEVIDAGGGGASIELNPIVMEARGITIVEAVRNLISLTTKTPYWSHVSIIIISQDIAREDITPVLDWIARSPELQLKLRIFISKEETAKEILNQDLKFTKIRIFEYENMRRSFKYLSKLPDIKVNKVINEVQRKELYPVLPTVGIIDLHGQTAAQFIGSAYFDKGRLIGILEPIDTMKYLFIVNQIEGGVLTIPTDEDDKRVTLDINRNHTRIDIDLIDGEIQISVDIKPVVNISEVDDGIDYTSAEGRTILKEISDRYLENEIKIFIEKMQKESGLDIFAFGSKIMKKHPNIWKEVGDSWSEIFSDLDIKVTSDIRIKSSQHTTTPIGVEVE